MHSLVTFLGKSQAGYRSTRYRFGDDTISDETRFFGLALAEHIAPDRLVMAPRNQVVVNVREHHGATLYAGGDDVLAMLPLDTAIPAARFARLL